MSKTNKHTQDAEAWRRNAESTFDAATLLFSLNNPSVWFSAAMLGHHALEMLLKSALLREGCKIAKDDVWGHDSKSKPLVRPVRLEKV